MKRIIASISVIMLVFVANFAVFPSQTAHAAECEGETFIFPKWYDGLCKEDGKNIASPQELGGGQGNQQPNGNGGGETEDTANKLGMWVTILALNLVTILLTVVVYVSLAFVIFGGFKYITSGDNSSGTVAARKTITNALIGLVISMMSVAIVQFISGVV
jgi:hypothetical protein